MSKFQILVSQNYDHHCLGDYKMSPIIQNGKLSFAHDLECKQVRPYTSDSETGHNMVSLGLVRVAK